MRLRDVSDYIANIIAENAVSSSIERCAPQIFKSAAADMTAQGESAYQEAVVQTEPSHLSHSSPSALQSQHANICLDNIASNIVNSSVTQVGFEVCLMQQIPKTLVEILTQKIHAESCSTVKHAGSCHRALCAWTASV